MGGYKDAASCFFILCSTAAAAILLLIAGIFTHCRYRKTSGSSAVSSGSNTLLDNGVESSGSGNNIGVQSTNPKKSIDLQSGSRHATSPQKANNETGTGYEAETEQQQSAGYVHHRTADTKWQEKIEDCQKGMTRKQLFLNLQKQ